nr:MAG TPA: tail repeat-like protein [Caudoviricetes sp.]
MAENITLAKPLKLATPGTAPIDGLTVATVKDIANIESPWNGMVIYCAADGKSYRVTKLKDVSTGVFTKKAVDTYEAVPDAQDMAAAKAEIAAKAEELRAEIAAKDSAQNTTTEFQVYATNAVIAAGVTDSETGIPWATDVPAGMTQKFKIRCDVLAADSDVVVEWGDGTSSAIAKNEFESSDDSDWGLGEMVYVVAHTYAAPGRYRVIVRGKQYWGFQQVKGFNIISRIFDHGYPTAGWLQNLSVACQWSPKIQKVVFPTGLELFANIHNAYALFADCVNLVSVKNCQTKFRFTRDMTNMFSGCTALKECDFQLPQSAVKNASYNRVFYNCSSLEADIANLLPDRGFDGKTVSMIECFRGCSKLTGTVPAVKLWEDMVINWTATRCFTDCSETLRMQVPASWGGMGVEVDDPHPVTRKQMKAYIADELEKIGTGGTGGSGTVGDVTGKGHVIGGYAARITEYDESAKRVTLAEDADMTKFSAGATATFNWAGTSASAEEKFASAEIATVDATNRTLTFSAAPDGAMPDIEKNAAWVRVIDPDRDSAASAHGEYNFVTGDDAHGQGYCNSATGVGAFASGAYNNVPGDFSEAHGVGNTVAGENNVAFGGNNTGIGGNNSVLPTAQMCFTAGNGNIAKGQSQIMLGCSNELTGHTCGVLGSANKDAEGASFHVMLGWGNFTDAAYTVTGGYCNRNHAKRASMSGVFGELSSSAENEGAFAVGGGEKKGSERVTFIHRSRRPVLNPLYNSSKDSGNTGTDSDGNAKYLAEMGASTEYAGTLKPMSKTVAVTNGGTLEFDPGEYSRYILTGSGSVTLGVSDAMADGDSIQIVLDTSKVTPTFPAGWVTLGVDVTTLPGLYVLEIAKVGTTIFYKTLFPDSQGGGGTLADAKYALKTHSHGIDDVNVLREVLNNKANVSALDDKANKNHSHSVVDVAGLQAALFGKAQSVHTHTVQDVTDLQTTLDGKANKNHTHAIANVTGLQSVLDNKVDQSSMNTALDGKANATHSHAIADVANLQTLLNGVIYSPTSGSAGQFLKLNEDGTCAWDNVLYPSFSDENKYMYYKYTIFPNGMIVQWGYTSFTNTETSVSKTFPIAFPNKCLCASVSTLLSDEDDTDNKRSGVDSFMQLVGYTKTDITLFRQTINNAKNISAAWIVIGY